MIITADHGESFGEHPGVFWHGTSLYQTRAPCPAADHPARGRPPVEPASVTETVSLRDLAATIVDVAGLQGGSPFPGESLARFWNGSTALAIRPGRGCRVRRSPRWSRSARSTRIPAQWSRSRDGHRPP